MSSDKLYTFTSNDVFGRHLIASMDIVAGQCVIDEPPLVDVPGAEGVSSTMTVNEFDICVVCCRHIDDDEKSTSKCRHCCVVLCWKCRDHPLHANNECRVLPLIIDSTSLVTIRIKTLMLLVVLIRCLFYRFRDPIRWRQIEQLLSNRDKLEDQGVFTDLTDYLVRLKWTMFDDKDDNECDIVATAKHCIGIMRMNAFTHYKAGWSREGLYFLTSFILHGCVPNTDRQMSPNGQLVIRAARDIQKGERLTTTYCSILANNWERWNTTIRIWFFACDCERCEDPTEFGLFLGALRCSKCQQWSLCLKRIDEDSWTWSCLGSESECLSLPHSSNITTTSEWDTVKLIEDGRESLPTLNNLTSFHEIEAWINQHEGKTLHSNHSVLVQIKYVLSQAYGRNCGLALMSCEALLRKMQLCIQMSALLSTLLRAGVFQCRGEILFDQWATGCEILRRQGKGKINEGIRAFIMEHGMNDAFMLNIGQKAMEILQHAVPDSEGFLMMSILRDELGKNVTT